MRHCPVCNNSIDASFGMVQCSNCQTVLFVDFGGNVIIGGNDEGSSDEAGGISPPEVPHDIELPQTEYSEVIVPEGVAEDPIPEPVLTDWNQTSEENNEPEIIESQVEEFKFESPGFEQSFDPEPPAFQNEPMQTVKQNSNLSQESRATHLRLIIEGIDVSSLRRAVLDVLQDHRLGLVRDELSGDIIEGRLIISNLNPVKASFIMNSLKGMALDIKWEMYAEDSKVNE